MKNFLLSDGTSTSRVEYYIIDLIKIYLSVYPGDIPGAPELGFDFVMNGVKKSDLVTEIKNSVSLLINKIKNRFNDDTLDIEISSISVISETEANIIVNVNGVTSKEIEVNLFN